MQQDRGTLARSMVIDKRDGTTKKLKLVTAQEYFPQANTGKRPRGGQAKKGGKRGR